MSQSDQTDTAAMTVTLELEAPELPAIISLIDGVGPEITPHHIAGAVKALVGMALRDRGWM